MVLLGTVLATMLGIVAGRYILASDRDYPVASPIQFDDFAFSALAVKEIPAGSTSIYELTAKIENKAKRVDFHFDSNIPQMFNGRRKLAVANPPEPETEGTLHAGESTIRHFRFYGSAGQKKVTIRFYTGGDVGEFLDTVLSGRAHSLVSVKG